MQLHEGHFRSKDGRKLYYRFHEAVTPGPCLIVFHGHGEHCGRYDKFLTAIGEPALSLAAFDFRGHGQSEGPEVYIDHFQEYMDDAQAFVEFMEFRYGVRNQRILLGHSMGGLVAVYFALRNHGQLAGLVLSSPCLGLKLPVPLVCMNTFLNSVAPAMIYSNPVYPPHLTHSPQERDNYKKDKWIRRKISVRLLAEMLSYMALLKREMTVSLDCPCFILAAGLEKVVDLDATKAFFCKLAAPEKKLEILDGYFHEIFNELGQEKAFAALKDSLNRILSSQH